MNNTDKTQTPLVTVAGLGPGHPDYILPVVLKQCRKAQVLVSGTRHLESLRQVFGEDWQPQQHIVLGSGHPLAESFEKIEEALAAEQEILILVSGDTGYYSMLSTIRKKLPDVELKVIPGISSLQYFFAALGMSWQDALMMSLHGREQDLDAALKTGKTIGLLTDSSHGTAWIAGKMMADYPGRMIYTGEELSYPEETITAQLPADALHYKEKGMAVVIIAGEA
ncbi:MAG: precorrin-6y C5,15-methyltransferase (decarboxylating) subunit CbiE [Eubacteriaceae bacterium]|jgi:cobalt-precorrin-7 (C5)-methyltransferase